MVGGSCGDQKMLDIFIGIVNLLQDVVVVVLPMPILWGLQMARSKKVALSCIFGIGIMYDAQSGQALLASKHVMLTPPYCRICTITIYRVQVNSTIDDPTNLHAQDTYCLIALLTSLEALLGVISACLPMLKPLFHKLRDSMSEGRAQTIKVFISGSILAAMRTSHMQNSSSEKAYLSRSYIDNTFTLV